MKKGTGFTLSTDNMKSVRKAAEKDDRSMSNWMDRCLTAYFKQHPV